MTQPSLLRALLAIVRRHRGRAGLQASADAYCLSTEVPDSDIVEAIVDELNDNGARFVLERRVWELDFWNVVLLSEFGVPPVDDLDDVVGLLERCVEGSARPGSLGTLIDGQWKSTEAFAIDPSREELSTDAELPSHAELLERYSESLGQGVPFDNHPAPRFCTQCGFPRVGEAQFCVDCGVQFGAASA